MASNNDLVGKTFEKCEVKECDNCHSGVVFGQSWVEFCGIKFQEKNLCVTCYGKVEPGEHTLGEVLGEEK